MKKRVGSLILVQLISVMGTLLVVTGFLQQGMHVFIYLYDFITLLLVLMVALPPLLVHGIWKDFLRVFQLGKKDKKFSLCEIKKTLLAIQLLQKQIIYGTIMIVGIYAIAILMNLDTLSVLGPNMAVDILSLVYMAAILLFIEPLKAYTQRYLEDYLAEEED